MGSIALGPLIAAGVVLLAGVVLALVLKAIGIQDGAIFIALLVLPMVVYGVASGIVREFTAPGGWGAKFNEVAKAAVDPAPVGAELEAEFQRLQPVMKGGARELERARTELKPGQAVAMIFVLGRGGFYAREASALYARTLLAIDPALTAIFVDGEGRFVASASGSAVLAALENPKQGDPLIDAIGADDVERIAGLVGVTRASVKAGTSNAEALERMLAAGVTSLIAVDEGGRPVGIVRRDDIVAKMLVKLASE